MLLCFEEKPQRVRKCRERTKESDADPAHSYLLHWEAKRKRRCIEEQHCHRLTSTDQAVLPPPRHPPAPHLLPTHPPPSVLPTTYLRSTLTPCLLIFHLPLASYMSRNRKRTGVVYNFGEIVPTSAPSHSPTTNPIVPPLVYVITVVMKVFQCVTFSHSPSPAEKLKLKMLLKV